MNTWVRFLTKFLISFCILLVAAVVGTIAVFKTQWGQNYIHETIHEKLKESGVIVTYKNLSGALPFQWDFSKISIQANNAPAISIDSLKFQLSLWKLFQNQIHLARVEAHNVAYEKQPETSSTQEIETTLEAASELPFTISLKSAKFYNVYPTYNPEKRIDIQGRLHIARKARYVFLDIETNNPKRPKTTLRLRARADRIRGVLARFDLHTPDTRELQPYWSVDLPAKTDLRIDLRGSWNSFCYLLFSDTPYKEQIRGKIQGAFTPDFGGASLLTKNLLEPEWQIKGNINCHPNIGYIISPIQIKNKFLTSRLTAEFNSSFNVEQAELRIQSKELSKVQSSFAVGGILDISTRVQKQGEGFFCTINGSTHALELSGESIDPLDIQINGMWKDPVFEGSATASFNFLDLPWDAKSEIFWVWKSDVHFKGLNIVSPTALLTSNLTLDTQLILNGQTELFFSDLSSFIGSSPTLDLRGEMKGLAYWYGESDEQSLQLDLNFYDMLIQGIKIPAAHVEVAATDTFVLPTGYVNITAQNTVFRGIHLDTALFTTSNESENNYFSFIGRGDWKGSFDLNTSGFYNIHSEERLFNIQELSGYMFDHSFNMPKPLSVVWTDSSLHIDEFELSSNRAFLNVQGKISNEESDLSVQLDHFPIDFLSLNQLNLDVSGFATMDLEFKQEYNHSPSGTVDLQLEQAIVSEVHGRKPISASGQFHAELDKEMLDLIGQLDTNTKELMHLKAHLPVAMQVYPFDFKVSDKKELDIAFGYDGPLEEILDFFNTGPQHLEGDLTGELHVTGTHTDPKIEGAFKFRDGIYENYYSGTYLGNIDANLVANKNAITLSTLSATNNEGKLHAKGYMTMDPNKNFPYHANVRFSKLECFNFDWIKATAKGAIDIEGSTKGASVKGNFAIRQADISIPDKITRKVPEMEVSYVHKPSDIPSKTYVQNDFSYPVDMDLRISAPDNVFVRGRGLSSKWNGDIDIAGQYPDLLAKGRLDMAHGEFVFSGKVFELTEGNLVFSNEESNEPFLNISGRLTEQDFVFTVNLKGPLTTPELAFRSNPPLPTGSILSYLIFGHDISELTPFEAVQLATAVASLSGGGPDILESTRRTLGVDRLAFVTQPTNKSDGSEIALKVGKYVTKGVLVSVAQGVGLDSTNIVVEVDLKKGFIFQAESQQQQEQGKFTLKWSRSY